jgi:putative nucleotidyltransferase with HDIG domain
MVDRVSLKDLIDKVSNLPTLPTVMTRIIRKAEDPATSVKDIVDIIEVDQALTMKILKIVNSAYYGFRQRIATIERAVVILGFNNVKNLALSASVFDTLGGEGRGEFNRAKFWGHSIGCGVTTKALAMKLRYHPQSLEEAFTAGLLHDIGKVVLDKYVHEEFSEVVRTAAWRDMLIAEAEREVLGADHADMGHWLAIKWGLPKSLKEVIAYHHNPEAAMEAKELTGLVHFADILVRRRKIGSGGDNKVPSLNPSVFKMLKLTQSGVEEIMNLINREMEKASVFFDLTGMAWAHHIEAGKSCRPHDRCGSSGLQRSDEGRFHKTAFASSDRMG